MPQSLNKVILHMVFSTKDRRPLIDSGIRPRLHAYMAEIIRDIEPPQSQAYRVGGVADHVHIAATLPRTVTIAKLFEIVKKESSSWIKKQGPQYSEFYWQNGYGNFSVARRNWINSSDTSTTRKNITRRSAFRMSFGSYCKNTTSNTMSDTSGIEMKPLWKPLCSRPSACPLFCDPIPRALPWASLR
jgi:putative transposase